eukprot:357516-Chlamydomonas_euryale.AAC.8
MIVHAHPASHPSTDLDDGAASHASCPSYPCPQLKSSAPLRPSVHSCRRWAHPLMHMVVAADGTIADKTPTGIPPKYLPPCARIHTARCAAKLAGLPLVCTNLPPTFPPPGPPSTWPLAPPPLVPLRHRRPHNISRPCLLLWC